MRHPLEVTREMNHRDVPRRQTPQDRPGRSVCPNRYLLTIHGWPSAGTITLNVTDGVTATIDEDVTINFDDDSPDVETAIATAAPGLPAYLCSGGPMPENNIKILVPAGCTLTLLAANTLTPDGQPANASLGSCCGPA